MQLPNSPTHKVSIVMLGDSGVGKTALTDKFVRRPLKAPPDETPGTTSMAPPETVPTVGVEQRFRTISVAGMDLLLEIVDTCGQERFKAISPQYYRRAAGILLVYDVTNRKGFSGLEVWVDKIRDVAHANVTIMVVGNKKDLDGQRVISYDEGKAFADRKGVSFIETAAGDAFSVEDAFTNTMIEICDKIKRHLLRNESHGVAFLKPSLADAGPSTNETTPIHIKEESQLKFSSCC